MPTTKSQQAHRQVLHITGLRENALNYFSRLHRVTQDKCDDFFYLATYETDADIDVDVFKLYGSQHKLCIDAAGKLWGLSKDKKSFLNQAVPKAIRRILIDKTAIAPSSG